MAADRRDLSGVLESLRTPRAATTERSPRGSAPTDRCVRARESATRVEGGAWAQAEDARVAAAVRDGDRAAESELYRRYAPLVARTAERLLRSTHDAQDVLQDTFILAFAEISSLRDPTALRAWLLQIAVRQVHRRFRRRRLQRLLGLEGPAPDARLDQLADEGTPPDVVVELALLDRALTALPDRERLAWILRRIEGYPLEDVAIACECSLATAKRRVAAVDVKVAAHVELRGDEDV